MQLKHFFSAFCLGAIALTSCGPKFKKNEQGLEYHYFKKSANTEINNGDILVGKAVIKNITKDSILVEMGTNDYTPPFTFGYDTLRYKNSNDPLANSFVTLRKGDSVEFRIVADSLFKGQPIPAQTGLSSGDIISYAVGIDKVLSPQEMQEFAAELQPRIQEAQRLKKELETAKSIKGSTEEKRTKLKESLKEKAEQLATDDQKIVEYITANNLKTEKTDIGLHYIIAESKDGKKVEAGDVIEVHYAGKNLKGELFDTSIKEVAEANGSVSPGREYKPFSLQVGAGQVIAGWDEGLALLKEGDKATFFIPSSLAYGERKLNETIGENEILIFDVEIVKVKKPGQKKDASK